MKPNRDIVQVRIPKALASRIDEAIKAPAVLYRKDGEPLEVRLFKDRQHFIRSTVEETLDRMNGKSSKEAA